MIMLLNTGCNLRCKFCTLHRENKQLSFKAAIRIIDEAQGLGVKDIVLTGGEPFLHPHFFEIAKHVKEKGLDLIVTTNGTRIKANIQKIIEAKIDSINISIDGTEKTHDSIRGKAGAYQQALEGIKLLLEKKVGKEVKVNYVVTKQNVRDLIPTYNFVTSLGANFDFWPVNDAPNMYIQSEKDSEAYLEAIQHIAKREGKKFLDKKEYYIKALDYHAGKKMCTRCLGLKDSFGINADGELVACCLWGDKDLSVGNAVSKPLAELWNSNRAHELRHRIYNQGCLAKCYNHSLYEFNRKTGESFEVRRG